jgi:hypothetical protein
MSVVWRTSALRGRLNRPTQLELTSRLRLPFERGDSDRNVEWFQQSLPLRFR